MSIKVAAALALLVAAGLRSNDGPADQIARLKAAGYMQLPGLAGGFSCGKCRFASSRDGAPFCGNQQVQAFVSAESGCCNLFFPATGSPVPETLWPANGAIQN